MKKKKNTMYAPTSEQLELLDIARRLGARTIQSAIPTSGDPLAIALDEDVFRNEFDDSRTPMIKGDIMKYIGRKEAKRLRLLRKASKPTITYGNYYISSSEPALQAACN